MPDDIPQSDLVRYSFQDDFIAQRLKNRETREEVRKQSDTDPESIERRRRDIGVLLNDSRNSFAAIYKNFERAKNLHAQIRDGEEQLKSHGNNNSAGSPEIRAQIAQAKAQIAQIETELRGHMQFSLLANSFCQSYALATIIDCITSRDEYPKEVTDRETGVKTTKWRTVRHSIGSLVDSLFVGDEPEDLEEGETPFPGLRQVLADLPTAAHVELVAKLFHDAEASRFANLVTQVGSAEARRPIKISDLRAPFSETRTDDNGVEEFIEDWYAEAEARIRAEMERKQEAAQRQSERRGGMDREEAEQIEKDGLDGILNREGTL